MLKKTVIVLAMAAGALMVLSTSLYAETSSCKKACYDEHRDKSNSCIERSGGQEECRKQVAKSALACARLCDRKGREEAVTEQIPQKPESAAQPARKVDAPMMVQPTKDEPTQRVITPLRLEPRGTEDSPVVTPPMLRQQTESSGAH